MTRILTRTKALVIALSCFLGSYQVTAQSVPELIYYQFDSPGTTVQNMASTPVSATGNVSGATIGGTGQFSTALLGNGGATASNSVDANWPLNLSGPWTLSMWVSGVTSSATSHYFFGGAGGSTFRAMTGTGLVSGGGNLLVRGTGLTDIPLNGIFDATGSPVVVHLVYDPTTSDIKGYVNGVLHNTVAQSPTVTLTGTNFTVGGYGTANGIPSGSSLDEFRLYNRALTSAEIASTWNQILPLIITADDAGVTTINNPGSPLSPGLHNIDVTIKNYGTAPLTSAQIGWQVGSTVGTPFAWTGNLAPNAVAGPITIGSFNFPNGNYMVKAWTSMPNGNVDGNNFNDTSLINIVVCTTVSGTFTIDQTAPTSATNFQSFNDAVQSLTSCGISGPVTFNVVPGSGPYNEQIVIPQITGSSATNRVTFNGNGETISYASTNSNQRAVIALDGADFFTFDSLVVDATSGTYGWGFHLTNSADNNEILNSTISTSTTSTSSTSFNGIVASGSNTSATSAGQTANNTLIQGNNISGGYYAISLNGNSTSGVATGNQVIDNTITDFYLYGVRLDDLSSSLVRGNDISRPTRTTVSTFYGVYVSGSNSENILIEKNRIHDPFAADPTPTGTGYGVYFTGVDATAANANLVVNNLIYNFASEGTIYGIYNSSSDNAHYYHNTISIDNTAATGTDLTRGFYQTSAATGVEFINNIISITRGGTGDKTAVYLNENTSTVTSNNNVLYVNGAGGNNYIGYLEGTGQVVFLSDWQLLGYDVQSVNNNPMFANPAAGNFEPGSQFADDIGAPLGVLTDITGATRSTTAPDPGAYEFTVVVACDAPTNIDAINITATSADITWNVASTAGDFTLIYGPAGFDPLTAGTQISAISGSPFFLSGLMSGTTYQIYIQQDCGASGLSVLSGPTAFSTPCLPLAGGTYTINAGQPTGAGNYNSYQAAVDALCGGVTGAVTFNVVAGSGPYNEQIIIPQITGTSATSRVTFNGNGETISYASTNSNQRAVIALNGADFFTFDSLVVDATNGTYGWGFHLTNDADNNEILNSTISTSTTSTSSTSFNGIVASGSNTSATTAGQTANNTLIQGNSISGGYYAISLNGNGTTAVATGNQVIDNTVTDFYFYGVRLDDQSSAVVRGNDISRPTRTVTSTFYGVYLSGTNSENNLVEKNMFHDPFAADPTPTGSAYAIYFTGADASASAPNRAINNLIYDFESEGTIYTIYNSSSDNALYYHNTISVDNIVANQSDITRGFYQTGTATGIEFLNNIISITRGGTGIKTGIYLNTSTSVVNSNYNVIYVNGAGGNNNIGYYDGNYYPTLAGWQLQGYDLNSVDADPQFTNPAAVNFTPTSQFADNIGTPVGVLTDITGAVRSTTIPDPGAYEFSVFVACPAPAGVNVTINNSISATVDWTVTTTLGDFTLIYGPLGFDPTTSGTSISALSSSPFTITPLVPGTTYQVYLQQDCGIAGTSVLSGPVTFMMPDCIAGTIAGASSFCYSGTPALSLPTATQQSTFQWQESSSATGPFTNIAGATASTYTASAPITTTTYYQAIVDCGTGPLTTPVFTVEVNSPVITSTNTPVTLCAPGVANLTAAASAGDVKWFDVATGGTALATGTTYSPTVTANTTYYAAAVTGTPPTSHTTTFAAGNGSNGNMFPITALNTVTILSFAGHTTSGTSDWEVWYRPDNYLLVPGANTSSTGWTLLGTANGVVSAGTGNPTPIPIPVNITIPAGMTYSFQVVTVGGTTVQYTNGTAVGNVFNANSDFQFIEGHGGSVNSMTFAPRVFNGVINYSSGCESPRVPVEVFVTPVDPITVAATPATICEGETVTLSVTNPQTGVAYTWMPGSIVGATATVTPTATTAYTVTGGNAGGCSATETVSVTVNPAPVATASSNSPIMSGDNLLLSASGGTSYSWVGPNGFSSMLQNPTIPGATPAAAGNYTVYVSNANCTTTAVVSVTIGSPQPLNGTYTINQTAPASTTNFVSFTTAADYLNTIGVSGPVIINVVAGTSPYTVQQFLLDEIPGSSATNTVTINGNGEVINFCGNINNRDIIRLNGTDHININGLVLNAVCNYGWGFHLMGDVENVTLADNTINLNPSSSMLIGSMAGILATNSMFNPQTPGGMISGLNITGNTINNGYYAIRLENATGSLGTGVVVSNNTMATTFAYGIDVRNMSNPTLSQNMISMSTGYQSHNSVGMVVINTENGLEVRRNRVINAGSMGLYLFNVNRTTTTRGTVANNMLGAGFQNSNIVHALQLNAASYLDVDYNSTLVENGAMGSAMYVSNLTSQQLKMRNNSFAYTGASGYALQANNGDINFMEIDNNNYYTTGAKFVRFSGADRMDMAQLQGTSGPANHNLQSMSADPMYVSATDLHLQANSPLIGQGMTLAGVPLDYDGGTRTTPTDIGADEFGVQLRQQATALDAEVYPNPFSNNLTVRLTSTEASNVQVVLSDLMGRQIMSRSYAAEAGITELAVGVEQQLSQGVYLLQVTQGEVTSIFRVVKQ